MNELLDVKTHFRFGENWADYSKHVDDRRIAEAVDSVKGLVGNLKGKTFLDIGSGSGLFSVSALRLGAKEVLATDLDPDSVATTKKLLSREKGGNWRAERISVFDLPKKVKDKFDVVYSWGVLHHTGAMWPAVEAAASMVKPGGLFAFSLYEKTPLCGFWVQEKRVYRKLPKPIQAVMRGGFYTAWAAALVATGHNPIRRWREGNERGMTVANDVHDWLGGYPYESTTPKEVIPFMKKLGFEHQDTVLYRIRLGGVFGSGCTEYVFRKGEKPAARRAPAKRPRAAKAK
jgi:2-polyprenyl-6-hydroxyphenyl methylase/3-demethylubiquinone-9 3-methyltransferase